MWRGNCGEESVEMGVWKGECGERRVKVLGVLVGIGMGWCETCQTVCGPGLAGAGRVDTGAWVAPGVHVLVPIDSLM